MYSKPLLLQNWGARGHSPVSALEPLAWAPSCAGPTVAPCWQDPRGVTCPAAPAWHRPWAVTHLGSAVWHHPRGVMHLTPPQGHHLSGVTPGSSHGWHHPRTRSVCHPPRSCTLSLSLSRWGHPSLAVGTAGGSLGAPRGAGGTHRVKSFLKDEEGSREADDEEGLGAEEAEEHALHTGRDEQLRHPHHPLGLLTCGERSRWVPGWGDSAVPPPHSSRHRDQGQ